MIPGVGSELVPATEKSVGSQVEASLGMDSEPRPQAETLRSLDLGDGGPALHFKGNSRGRAVSLAPCPPMSTHQQQRVADSNRATK